MAGPGSLNVISADSHVIEPPEVWQRCDTAYRDRAPRLVREETTDRLVCEQIDLIPIGYLAGCARHGDDVRAEGRWEEDVFAAGYDPDERVRELEKDVVDAEVLFPTLGMALYPLDDAGFRWALFRGYNDWLAEFCASHPDRFRGVAMLDHEDVDLAVHELERAKGLGLSAVMLPLHLDATDSYGNPRLDPLWHAAADNGMPVNIHTATTRLQSRAWKGTTLPGSASDGVLASPTEIQRHLLDITFAGVFDRVPDLRVVSAELDAGWAAFMLQRADNWFGRNRKLKASDAVRCERPPTEYFASNIRITFQDDQAAMRTADLLGDEVLMWGSDFPHHSSTWPHSAEVIASQLDDRPADVRYRLVRDNAAALYGF